VTHRLEPLHPDHDHDLERLDCGNDDLSAWLRQHARHATRQGTRTYVLVDERSGVVEGYFAIAPHMVEREEMPRRVGRGAPRQIPAILLAKLALDRSRHGQGLGGELLVRALGVIVEAGRRAGGKVIVVDAIDDGARRFYEHHDFDPLPNDPTRLVMKVSTAAALQLPWP
jgi:GNAT superfamily N-acetyltransferase